MLPDKSGLNVALIRTSKSKYDGRHLIDGTGLLLGVVASLANDSDGQRLTDLLQRLLGKAPWLEMILTDSGHERIPSILM
ncbi:hypothetical protein GGP93_003152 [Salinibacter ruber]|nr:hypothetical protein [Salinibacter ruber]